MNKPVAWWDGKHFASKEKSSLADIPLYTHPHPDNLGLALSIIDQQKLEIENLRKADLTHKSLCKAELTDEEILEELLIPKSEWDSYKAHHCLKQIRAILRKANEK